MIRLVLTFAAVTMVAGCAAERVGPTTSAATGSSGHAALASAQVVCHDMFPKKRVLGWMPATVGALRAYHFGGPVGRYPLRSAFAGVAATRPGAWCVVGEGAQSDSMWGVVPGDRPARAITVTGPGEGTFRGELPGPLQPP